ncbi:MAG: Short-chain dehydrogenase [Phormidesmis priestleyi Ana]|uniref:Short-chain dehydrogenase n=1 Tax=Phormidesmis priestleyi Ana TaxID=1666911 RepID=A0A0P8BXN7_9CYAN|nr:MAG: Short-chain dehydrogenase [Phormidesmis priestleyi Ana]
MKVALVTGGSEGIGRAIATRFAKENYHVVIAARDAAKLTEAASQIKTEWATPVVPMPTDVRDPKQVQDLVEQTIADFGQLDVLVNNAGLYSTGPTEEFTLEDWHQVIDTNLWGYIHTIQAALPHFIAQQKGAIVNLCSIAGKLPMPYLAPYTTSKFAISGLSQALSAELSPKGIQVCAVYPNIIKTAFPEKAVLQGKNPEDKKARYQQLKQTVSMPFIEKPEDVANGVWQALQNNESEPILGSAKLMGGLHALLPRLTQRMLRMVFQNKDSLTSH